jgi:hypothetical protein
MRLRSIRQLRLTQVVKSSCRPPGRSPRLGISGSFNWVYAPASELDLRNLRSHLGRRVFCKIGRFTQRLKALIASDWYTITELRKYYDLCSHVHLIGLRILLRHDEFLC